MLKSNLFDGLVASLCEAYADQPRSAAEDALLAAVQRASVTEKLPIGTVECDADFGAACPVGALCARCCLLAACRADS